MPVKKKLFLVLTALCVLLLCACGRQPDDGAKKGELAFENAAVSENSRAALLAAQTEPAGEATKLEKIAFGLIALAIGIFIVVKPRAAWHLSHGRKYRHVDPPKISLVMEYITGAIVIAAGVGLLLL